MDRIENRTFDELQVGDTASIARTLTYKDIELFAIMSGDVNPAHVDEEFARSDMFHRIIAQASGNPILAALIETLTSAMYEKRRKTVAHANYLRGMAEMHREIFRAIRSRDSSEARRLMEEHLHNAENAQNTELLSAAKRNPVKKTSNK